MLNSGQERPSTASEVTWEVSEMSQKNAAPPRKTPAKAGDPAGLGVAERHLHRGRADTPWLPPSKGSTGRFWKMLAASAVFHLFLTPGPALLGLVAMLPALDLASREELIEVDLTAIPVGAVAPEPVDEKPLPPEPEEAAPLVSPEDADQAENSPDEPAQTEEPKPASPELPTEPSEEVPRETEVFGDPVALAGSAGSIADSNANVRMFLFTEVVREHPLGVKIGELLRRTPQWRDFFGPSQIDPVKDIDRVMIAGPQLRNSSQVVAVVQHNMGRDRIEGAFRGLVARQGKWIDQTRLLAKARADGADRVFAAPSAQVVLVAPLALEKQVQAMGADATFPSSAKDVALTAYIVTPANVAKGTGIQLPQSIKWARLDLRPLENGGAILKILALDESEEMAAQNALFFENLIRAVTTVDPKSFGLLGAVLSKLDVKKKEYIKSVKFTHEGEKIHGAIEVTESQMVVAVGLLEGYLPPLPGAATSADEGASSEKEPAIRAETPPTEAPEAPPITAPKAQDSEQETTPGTPDAPTIPEAAPQ